ncbi:MAG: hypothetical protein ACQET7_06205 [Thermodesulfobacteriota bacterium]
MSRRRGLKTARRPVINAGVLLSGHLRVQNLDGKVLDLRAGEAIVEVVDPYKNVDQHALN